MIKIVKLFLYVQSSSLNYSNSIKGCFKIKTKKKEKKEENVTHKFSAKGFFPSQTMAGIYFGDL